MRRLPLGSGWNQIIVCSLKHLHLSTFVIMGWMVGCETSHENDEKDRTEQSESGGDIIIYDSIYDMEEVLEIDIALPESDWETLSNEGRKMAHIGCEDFSYTHFFGDVTIGNETFEQVRMRKKGFLGSISTVRPSLKLNLDTVKPKQRYLGTKRFTLNNDRQDASHLRQCLSYHLFRKAGVPAPLCALSHITVNGEEIGIYSNVEPIKKPFLERVFKDDSGNLYEGPVVDVTKSQYRFLEVKTNEKEGDISDLKALADALEAPDSKLEKQLGAVINLEAFYTFWAMEVLTGHWDSYSGNRNNYYLYHNPEDDLFYFIPWGTDQAFADYNFFRPADQEVTIYPNGEISRRLYALDDGKRFRQRLQELLDEYWDEEDLLDRAEALSALTGTTLSDTDQIVNFISGRRDTLADQLKADIDVSKKLPDPQPATCDDEPPRSTGTIEMTWRVAGGEPGPATVEAMEVTVQGAPLQFEEGSILGMAYDFPGYLDTVEIGVAGIQSGTDRTIWIGFHLAESQFEVGTVPFHGFETIGMVLELYPPTYSPGPLLTVITDGELTLERVSDEFGETVRASWDGIELAFVPE